MTKPIQNFTLEEYAKAVEIAEQLTKDNKVELEGSVALYSLVDIPPDYRHKEWGTDGHITLLKSSDGYLITGPEKAFLQFQRLIDWRPYKQFSVTDPRASFLLSIRTVGINILGSNPDLIPPRVLAVGNELLIYPRIEDVIK